MNKKTVIRVLAIEDNRDDATLIKLMLTRVREPEFIFVHAQRLSEGIAQLDAQPFDVVLLDLGLPDSQGIETVQKVKASHPGVPVIVFSGLEDEEIAISTLQMDVQDYLTKGTIDGNLLARSIRYSIERKHSVEALRTSEARFRRLSESGIIGIANLDAEGKIVDANDKFLSMIGADRVELAEGRVRRWGRLVPPEGKPRALEAAGEFRATGRITPYETEYLSRDGSKSWGLFGAARLEGEANGIAFILDITERKRLEDEIRHMAHHDVLTGLPNRRLFLELLQFELAEARRNQKKTGLLFLDLDRFKEINDTLGHEAGDQLLKTVAERLRSVIRKADAVARIGGDEFSILLADIACPEDIAVIVRKILDVLSEKCVIAGRAFSITTSMGISFFPDDSEDIDELFRYADMALYRAKDRGRNTFAFYNEKMNPGACPALAGRRSFAQ